MDYSNFSSTSEFHDFARENNISFPVQMLGAIDETMRVLNFNFAESFKFLEQNQCLDCSVENTYILNLNYKTIIDKAHSIIQKKPREIIHTLQPILHKIKPKTIYWFMGNFDFSSPFADINEQELVLHLLRSLGYKVIEQDETQSQYKDNECLISFGLEHGCPVLFNGDVWAKHILILCFSGYSHYFTQIQEYSISKKNLIP